MTTTVDAIFEHGVFRPKRAVSLKDGQVVRLTIVSSQESPNDAEFTALASEESLARIWNDPVEDEAWAHL
jgi:predicted DNA-binding antitoxin AbrB/MazE fold protein